MRNLRRERPLFTTFGHSRAAKRTLKAAGPQPASEHVFGTLKDWMGRSHFKTRTLGNVGTEASLHILAYNIKRAIALLGATGLIAAMQA